jgi:hypothetical protein
LASLVEPAAERLRDFVNGGFRVLISDSNSKVVDGDVLLCRAADGDLTKVLVDCKEDASNFA